RSNSVNEGDVLLLEEGIYFQAVAVTKNYIRIVAKGPGVIFDGRSTLLDAFILPDVVGVGIEGITMRHYRASGVLIEFGGSHRIVNNKIHNMLENGVEVMSSRGNLIWKNDISYCYDGVLLISGSTNNWVIENVASRCYGDGFESFLAPDSNNAFISNLAIGNRNNGIEMFGSNNLAFHNTLIDNGLGVIISQERDSVVIGNQIKGTLLGTHVIFEEYTNDFAGGNTIVCNREEGIENDSGQFGIIMDNEISYNGDSGILLGEASSGNLVMKNKLICNLPENITDRGSNNNIINHIDKPCESCESPSAVCDAFSDAEDCSIDESKAGVYKWMQK
ncbi:MAG TPA: hypothetical protein GX503_07585, partial [Clostridiales bacterium]|nr:hypothetical protein [Clostridiales bacterium]